MTIEIILTITGAVVWGLLAIALIILIPVLIAFVIGFTMKRLDIMYDTRCKLVSFVDWYLHKIEVLHPRK